MDRANFWILVARLVQISLGLAIMGSAIENFDWYGGANEILTAPTWMGAVISAIGSFGLIGIDYYSNEECLFKVYLLVLYADVYAFGLSITSAAFLIISDVSGNYNDGGGGFRGPAARACICAAITAVVSGRSSLLLCRGSIKYRSEPGELPQHVIETKQPTGHVIHNHYYQTACPGTQFALCTLRRNSYHPRL